MHWPRVISVSIVLSSLLMLCRRPRKPDRSDSGMASFLFIRGELRMDLS